MTQTDKAILELKIMAELQNKAAQHFEKALALLQKKPAPASEAEVEEEEALQSVMGGEK